MSGQSLLKNKGTPPFVLKLTIKLPKYSDKGAIQVRGKEPISRTITFVTARRNAEGRLLKSIHFE